MAIPDPVCGLSGLPESALRGRRSWSDAPGHSRLAPAPGVYTPFRVSTSSTREARTALPAARKRSAGPVPRPRASHGHHVGLRPMVPPGHRREVPRAVKYRQLFPSVWSGMGMSALHRTYWCWPFGPCPDASAWQVLQAARFVRSSRARSPRSGILQRWHGRSSGSLCSRSYVALGLSDGSPTLFV